MRFYSLALILQADIIRFMHGSPFILESWREVGRWRGNETIKWLETELQLQELAKRLNTFVSGAISLASPSRGNAINF